MEWVYIVEERRKFRNNYISKCISNKAGVNLAGNIYEYHYTLYYYDQAGNLVKTIPPEGVRFLTDDELKLVDDFRDADPKSCDGSGMNAITHKPTVLTALGNNTTAGKSMEMWLYANTVDPSRQVRFITDDKYMYQAAISNKKVWVDVFSIQPGTGGSGEVELTLSNHVVADLGTVSIQNWTHIVFQSTGLVDGTFDVYVDSKKLTNLDWSTTTGYPFEWEVTGGYTLPAEDLAQVKHVRLYHGTLTQELITTNFKDICMYPHSTPNVWGRFNIPDPDGETTVGDGTTNEWVQRFIVPKHALPTYYAYNSQNQVVAQHSPDAGGSTFFYDNLGRLIVSQNAEQKTPVATGPEDFANRYSYTKYDALGRIVEVGEKINSGITFTELMGRSEAGRAAFFSSGSNRQVTATIYDAAPSWASAELGITQFNLRKRVAATMLLSTGSDPAVNREAASYYSYDIGGNVDVLIQENKALKDAEFAYIANAKGLKKIKYEYDLVSGKVNKVLYQDGKWDQFYYQYQYDPENRLIKAWSSRENLPGTTGWRQEAAYSYYLHGPLARVELGPEGRVQGVDYAYTLQGWLKYINGPALNADMDMSKDGKYFAGNPFSAVARDVYSYGIEYYQDDYKPIGFGSTDLNFSSFNISWNIPGDAGQNLFNGNISKTIVGIKQINGGNSTGYVYRYDQLNRLVKMRQSDAINISGPTARNFNLTATSYNGGQYKEDISYDANGNILSYLRNGFNKGGAVGTAMDNLNYAYNESIDPVTGILTKQNNRLRHVAENPMTSTVDVSGAYTEDLETQPTDNYRYDAIGNLIGDYAEGLTAINWTVYGKIAGIVKSSGQQISYKYDASGNRITKANTANGSSSFYVRDAQGNVLAVYERTASGLAWKEQHLYGSSRIGMLVPPVQITAPLPNDSYAYTSTPSLDPAKNAVEGIRRYELSNHLGNVLAVVSDKITGVNIGGDPTDDYYVAELMNAQDYYPFGMLMPGRKYSADGAYKYGFNGKENDNDVKGEGNQQDYGMRIYDPRIGKFLSVDPLTKKYAFYTPYQFASNSPIMSVDIDGLESSNAVNRNEMDGGGNPFRVPGNAVILSRLKGNDELKSNQKSKAVAGGVNTFSIDGKVFSARFVNGKFDRYESRSDDREIYEEDNYVYGGFTDDKIGVADVTWQKVELKAVEANGKLNFKYFGLTTGYQLGTFDYHNYTDWSKSELAIDLGFEGSVTQLDLGLRLGSRHNNVFVNGQAKLFNAEANLNGGIFTGENNKYGAGVNLGAGASVFEGNVKFGGTLLGMKVAGSVAYTAVSAHIGANNSYLYDSKSGVFSFKIGADIGLMFGAKGALKIDIPVRQWANNTYAAFNYLTQ